MSSPAPTSELLSPDDLYALFEQRPPPVQSLEPFAVPRPYRELLAHTGHMTVTLERHHQTKVRLEVLQERLDEPRYARKILLRHGETEEVLQFGIMRFDFRFASGEVRTEILERRKPLGRILLDHGMLTRVGTHGMLAIAPDRELRELLGLTPVWDGRVYGRLATIFCDERQVVDLLEVVRPEPPG